MNLSPMKNKGLLPLGLIVSLSITLTGFEYMSSETLKTKKMVAHTLPEDPEIVYTPELPKPEVPKVPQQDVKANPNPGGPVNPVGPIVASPIAPSDPIDPIWEPSVDPIVTSQKEEQFVFDSPIEPDFMEEFPTYEEFTFIKDREERYTKTNSTLINNVKSKAIYPELAIDLNIKGTVYVSFIVDKDGSITDVKIAKGVHESLDREAIKAVKKLPRMIPGKQHDKPVKVKYTIPVKFELR